MSTDDYRAYAISDSVGFEPAAIRACAATVVAQLKEYKKSPPDVRFVVSQEVDNLIAAYHAVAAN